MTIDACFELLSSWQRRFVLQYLQQCATPVTLDRLARSLAASCDELSADEARIQLHHHHLPKLAAAELVAYDRTAATVGPSTSAAEPRGSVTRVDAAVDELTDRLETRG